jgi:hypothetical protein
MSKRRPSSSSSNSASKKAKLKLEEAFKKCECNFESESDGHCECENQWIGGCDCPAFDLIPEYRNIYFPPIPAPDSVGQYSFRFRHNNEEQAANVEGIILFETKVIGTLSAKRFTRGPGFFGCADVTGETMTMAVLCFDDNGSTRAPLNEVVLPSANIGSLLYIQNIQVNPDHRGKDLGLYFTNACLDCFDMCSLFIIQPYPLNFWEQYPRDIWENLFEQPTPRPSEELMAFHVAKTKVARHFARIGFKQIVATNDARNYWYLERERRMSLTKCVVTKQDVASLVVLVKPIPPPPPILTEADKLLKKLLQRKAWEQEDQLALFVNTLIELKNQGASFETTAALHILVANQAPCEVVKLVVNLGADPLYIDPATNCSVLHLAASNRDENLVIFLLEKGADKDQKDENGYTPLRVMNETIQSSKDFLRTFDMDHLDHRFHREAIGEIDKIQRLRQLLS